MERNDEMKETTSPFAKQVVVLCLGCIFLTSAVVVVGADVSAPSTVKVDETFEASVTSLNSQDTDPQRDSADPCYGSGIDRSRNPAVELGSSSLEVISRGDWNYVGGVVGYEYIANLQGIQEDSSADFRFNVYCNDGSTEYTDWQSVSVENVEIQATLEDVTHGSGDYTVGESVRAEAVVRNTGNTRHTFYLGYSVQGPNGNWYNNDRTTGQAVTLDPDETRSVDLTWEVDSEAPDGTYTSRLRVWKESEPENLHTSLASDDRTRAFDVRHTDPFVEYSAPSSSQVSLEPSESTMFELQPASDTVDGTDLNVNWYLDGSPAGSGTSFSVDWSDYSPGDHTVRAAVSDGIRRTDDPEQAWSLSIVGEPSIESVHPTGSIQVGKQVEFDASAHDPSGYTPLEYSWNIGGSTYSSASPTVTFDQVGQVDVTLEVVNSEGVSVSKSFTIDVTDRAPQIQSMTVDRTTIDAGESIAVEANAIDPANRDIDLDYAWKIAGQEYTGSETSIQLMEPGTHEVTLTVANEHGTTASRTRSITVENVAPMIEAADVPGSITSTESVTIPVSVTHTGDDSVEVRLLVDGEAVATKQVSGGGGTVRFTHSFTDTGARKVEVEVVDSFGGTDQVEADVSVQGRPPSLTSYSPDNTDQQIQTGSRVEFSVRGSDPENQPVTYRWLVDGNLAKQGQQTYSNEFSQSGIYQVTAIAEDSDGLRTTRTWTVQADTFRASPSLSNHSTASHIGLNGEAEILTFSVHHPSANERPATVEIDVDTPSGLNIVRGENVDSTDQAQSIYQGQLAPGESAAMALHTRVSDDSLVGETVQFDYQIRYYPADNPDALVVFNESSVRLTVGDPARSTIEPETNERDRTERSTTSAGGPGFTMTDLLLSVGTLLALVGRWRRWG